MALAFVAPEFIIPLQRSASAAKGTMGEGNYKSARAGATWTWGAINGFSPIPPMLPLFPIKIALFVVILLICIFVFDMGAKSIVAAYLGQAIIVMVATEWLVDKVLRWGVGI